MRIIDLRKKRPLTAQTNVILLGSGFSVGYTRCYFLSGHPSWLGYVVCFLIGYVVTILAATIACALSAFILNLDSKRDHDVVMIIASMTLIVASLLLLISSLSGFLADIH